MKLFIFLLALGITAKSISQGPPPVASTPKENIPLIDQLMTTSGYEAYFKDYCFDMIDRIAEKKGWNSEMIKNKKSKVSFEDFKEYTVYNAFAFVTKDQLKSFIKLAKEMREITDVFFITNYMIQNNLIIFVESRYLN